MTTLRRTFRARRVRRCAECERRSLPVHGCRGQGRIPRCAVRSGECKQEARRRSAGAGDRSRGQSCAGRARSGRVQRALLRGAAATRDGLLLFGGVRRARAGRADVLRLGRAGLQWQQGMRGERSSATSSAKKRSPARGTHAETAAGAIALAPGFAFAQPGLRASPGSRPATGAAAFALPRYIRIARRGTMPPYGG